MHSLFEFLIYLIIGLAAGFSSGLFGIGGGVIVVPALLTIFYALDFPPEKIMQMAVATSITAMVMTSGSSAWAHRKGVDWRLLKALLPGILLGSFLGAYIAYLLPTKTLQNVFGIFLCFFGIYFLLTAKNEEIEKKIKTNHVMFGFLGVLVGTISSVLGIGGGILTVPVLILVGASLRKAISTSAATGFFIAFVGALSFFYLGWQEGDSFNSGYVYVPAFIVIGLAAMIMAPQGAKFAYSTSSMILKRIFGSFQIIIGILMIYF